MKLRILIPVRPDKPSLRQIEDYLGRIRGGWSAELVHPKGKGPCHGARPDEARRKGADWLLDHAAPRATLVALDERGEPLTSRELAQRIDGLATNGISQVDFLVGPPDGLEDRVKERADLVVTLSRLTLPHTLALVVLAEQLYRARTIVTGHPYHR